MFSSKVERDEREVFRRSDEMSEVDFWIELLVVTVESHVIEEWWDWSCSKKDTHCMDVWGFWLIDWMSFRENDCIDNNLIISVSKFSAVLDWCGDIPRPDHASVDQCSFISLNRRPHSRNSCRGKTGTHKLLVNLIPFFVGVGYKLSFISISCSSSKCSLNRSTLKCFS